MKNETFKNEPRLDFSCIGSTSFGNVLLLGSNGGVSRVLLELLAKHPAGQAIAKRIDTLLLLDTDELSGEMPVHWSDLPTVVLPPKYIDSGRALAVLFSQYKINQTVELADVDTLECVAAAEASGSNYLCTGYESHKHRPGLARRLGSPLCPTSMILLPRNRPRMKRRSHLIGSGMNPGIVNSLVDPAIDRFASAVGVESSVEALDLYAILFTEEDSTHELRDVADAKDYREVFAMTWNAVHCLNEVLAPASKFISRGRVQRMEHAPHRVLYQARCGLKEIEGMLIAHEEVFTIGSRYSEVDVGYIYRLLPHAHHLLRSFPEKQISDWKYTRKLYPPTTDRIEGVDRVGVLLCSRTFGEFWIGFENNCAEALGFGTNATLMQVAAGVLSGWYQLGEHVGLHLVEELDSSRYLSVASSILGDPVVIYDPDAPTRPLRSRRVMDSAI